jgi:hypothetical protein
MDKRIIMRKYIIIFLILLLPQLFIFSKDNVKAAIIFDNYKIKKIGSGIYPTIKYSDNYFVIKDEENGIQNFKIISRITNSVIHTITPNPDTSIDYKYDVYNKRLYYADTIATGENRIVSIDIEQPNRPLKIDVISDEQIYDLAVSEKTIAYITIKNEYKKLYLKTSEGTKLIATSHDMQDLGNYNGKLIWTNENEELFYLQNYETNEIIKITENGHGPSINKNIIAWFNDIDTEIKYFNGTDYYQLTNNNTNDLYPSIYNGKIAWTQNIDDAPTVDRRFYYRRVMYWDGEEFHIVKSYYQDLSGNNMSQAHTLKVYMNNGFIFWSIGAVNHYDYYYSKVDTPVMQSPNSQKWIKYNHILKPIVDFSPEINKPIGLGDIDMNVLSINVETPYFDSPVDMYLIIYIPKLSNELFLFNNEGSINPISKGIVKWKTNITEKISNTIYEGAVTDLPDGNYKVYLYLVVMPTGILDLDKAYIWETGFDK